MAWTVADLLGELTIHNSLGCWVVASWIFCFLWSLEMTFAYRYFSTYKNDRWHIRLLVITVLLAGTAKVIATCIGCYQLAIQNFGNYLKAITPAASMALTPLMTGLTSLLVQSYLIYRFWMVSRKWLITLVIEVMAVAAFAFCIWGSISLIKLSDLKNLNLDLTSLKVLPHVVYGLNAVVDIAIAVALITFLSKLRRDKLDNTRNLLTRLSLIAAQTGVFTTVLYLACVIAFGLKPYSQLSVPFSGACGYAQAFCLLYNLSLRNASGDSTGTHSSRQNETHKSFSNTRVSPAPNIMYRQETVTFAEVDPPYPQEEKSANADAFEMYSGPSSGQTWR